MLLLIIFLLRLLIILIHNVHISVRAFTLHCYCYQGVLYLLNECGYPNIHSAETLAVIRLCKDLLHVEQSKGSAGSAGEEGEGEEDGTDNADASMDDALCNNYARGHFYTNDVKVILLSLVDWLFPF